jgi:hypothetical protein
MKKKKITLPLLPLLHSLSTEYVLKRTKYHSILSVIGMSFDNTSLVLGSVDGLVLVLSLQNPDDFHLIQIYRDMHDLPITALSPCCRWYNPTNSSSTAIDITTASADGKLNFI